MKRRNYKESGIPEHLYAYVRYTRDMPGTRWATTCILRDRVTNQAVARAHAFCSKNDQPVRKVGRAIAIGRALKAYWEKADA